MFRSIKRIVSMVVALLTLLALWDQLVRDPAFRDWHRCVFGVPYDFRVPTPSRIGAALWSSESSQLLSPHAFALGWTPNDGRLYVLFSSRLGTPFNDGPPSTPGHTIE